MVEMMILLEHQPHLNLSQTGIAKHENRSTFVTLFNQPQIRRLGTEQCRTIRQVGQIHPLVARILDGRSFTSVPEGDVQGWQSLSSTKLPYHTLSSIIPSPGDSQKFTFDVLLHPYFCDFSIVASLNRKVSVSVLLLRDVCDKYVCLMFGLKIHFETDRILERIFL